MLNDWRATTRDYSAALKPLRGGQADVMKGFSSMAGAALKAGALDTKTKELLAVGISVAIRCDPCIAFHTEAALRQGATRAEVLETVGLAIYMGAGPSAMYAARALDAYDHFAAEVQAAD